MKHLKKYKIFEADIEKSFDDWLKDPQAPRAEFNYQFEFPVKKVFNVDESQGLDGDSLIQYLRYEQGIDICQDIANELDLSVDNLDFDEDDDIESEEISISKDDVAANFDEYFDQWIQQEYNGDTSKFYRMYNLDYEDTNISKDDFESLKDDFNQNDLKQYYTYKEYNHDFKILTLEVTELIDTNIVKGSIKTDRDLTPDEIDSIKDYIEGQCSDGWGEGFEQEQEKEEIQGLKFYTSIKPWWMEGYPEWSLDIKPI